MRIIGVIVILLCIYLCTAHPFNHEDDSKYGELLREQIKQDSLHSRSKFWIYFVDKGSFSEEEYYNMKEKILQDFHSKTIQRRLKMNPTNTLHDLIKEEDIPVNDLYIQQITSIEGVTLKSTSNWGNAISIAISEEHQLSVLHQISQLYFVKQLELVRTFKKHIPQSIHENVNSVEMEKNSHKREMLYDFFDYGQSQFQLDLISVPQLHFDGFNGTGVHILILDSGFNLQHPSILHLDIIAQRDFVNGDNIVSDQNVDEGLNPDPERHGTGTLSVLGGMDDGNLYGPAFGASFILAKTEDVTTEDPVEEDYFAEAIEWGESLGADVVSASLGYQKWYNYSQKDGTDILDIKIDFAVKQGVVVVIAAGNDQIKGMGVTVPADSKFGITVGAINEKENVAPFSSWGPTFDGRIKPDVAALGENVWAANYKMAPLYMNMSGTSLATPLVAGSVALLLQANPNWKPIDVFEALTTTASNKDSPNNAIGWGIINSEKALLYTPPTNTSTDHGVCNDYNDCKCDYPYYGAYCSLKKVPCESYCTGGICIEKKNEIVCTCTTEWTGMVCSGVCGSHSNCSDCLFSNHDVVCGWCDYAKTCIDASFSSTCVNGYSTSYCVSEVILDKSNMDSYLVASVIILCFSLLLLGSVCLFFFCIVRP